MNSGGNMVYDSDYPNEPIGGDNPYYCCSSCKLSDPQINGDINRHHFWCLYRIQKQGYKLTSTQYYDLLDELDREDLQDYTVVVMAARDMESNNIVSALARLKVDADQLRMVSPKLYAIILAQSA
jgi:hypothetical protein